MKKVLITLAASALLVGCAPLKIMEMAAFGLSQFGSPEMIFNSTQAVHSVEGQRVSAAKLKPNPSQRRHKCDAQAVVVDYTRDWDIVDEATGDTIRKAEPDKIHNQAILVYRLFCEEDAPKAVLRIPERKVLGFLRKAKVNDNEYIITHSYFDLSENARPRWMAQVIRTIQNEATTNPAAQDFLDNIKIGEDGLPINPENPENPEA